MLIKQRLILVFLLASAFGLTGCAVMDKKDCINANWYGLGRMDALNGEYIPAARGEACAEHGLGMDRAAYDSGVQEGLRGFCTAASGHAHGENGGVYSRGFCPSISEADFLSGYTPAYQKYQFRQRIMKLQRQIDDKSELIKHELAMKNRNERVIENLRDELKSLRQKMHMEMYMQVLN